jgi:predicted ATPase
MIKKITIQNFKSLENVTLNCSNLNVLTGLNGMGKSSVIQALLLLRQSHERGLLQEGLALNGELVQIGTVKDALFEFAIKEELNFDIDFLINEKIISKSWFFIRDINDPNSTEEEKAYIGSDFMPHSTNSDVESNRNLNELINIPLFNHKTFKYLNADRWVRNEYETSDFNVVRNKSLGKHGQYTSHYLNYFGANPITKELLFPKTNTNELAYQVSAWMNEISPGTKVVTERIAGSDSIKLRYIFEGDVVNTNELKPLNVGFGITYVFPILVALLSSRKGDVLIIENPESHVHPKAQSVLGKLMSKVAETGVQIFIETHSDHILNGIRVGIKNGVSKDLVKLFFFTRVKEREKIYSDFQTPNLDQDGRIDFWPDNFFDEWDTNLVELL